MTIKVGMISLGCSKNQVDAERLLAMLAGDGFTICNDMTECDAVIVNTCGFIEDAKKESIDTILECCAAKGEGSLKCVAAAWRSATVRSWHGRSLRRMWCWG